MEFQDVVLYIIGVLVAIIGFFLVRFFVNSERSEKKIQETRLLIVEGNSNLEQTIIKHNSDLQLLIAGLTGKILSNTEDIVELRHEMIHIKDLIDLTNGKIDKIEGKMYIITNALSDRILIMETEHKLNHAPRHFVSIPDNKEKKA